MAKNFATLYNSANDSSALNQKFFVKEETTRGTFIAPVGTDYLWTKSGGSANSTQPIEQSEHKTGRHNSGVIPGKIETNWSLPTYINIDTSVAIGTTEIDQAVRTLLKSVFGEEDTTTGIKYNASVDPDLTFTLLENGDKWAKQTVGAFAQQLVISLPGEGTPGFEFSGMAKTQVKIGIGLTTTDNDGGNTITLQAGEGGLFKENGYIMLVEADGTTRSADTPDGSPRKILSISTDTLTIDGAALADADGSSADIYVCYYEPETPAGINEPQTGLVGSIEIDGGLSGLDCVREATITITNNHEAVSYCYGVKTLSGRLFIPADRVGVECALNINLNDGLLKYINGLDDFAGSTVKLIVGDTTTRHLEIYLPAVVFPVPEVPVPENGSIPVQFTGMAQESTLEAADEIELRYK